MLYVCTGNVCRSPVAERLFRSRAEPAAAARVSSAGIRALVGEAIDRSSAAALAELGVDPAHHRARQFEPAMAAWADLVLTADVAQRDYVMSQVPAAFRRTFTMKEFARLARLLSPGPAAEVIAQAASMRGADGRLPDGVDDVPDPYRGTLERARVIAAQVSATVDAAIGALGLQPAGERVSE